MRHCRASGRANARSPSVVAAAAHAVGVADAGFRALEGRDRHRSPWARASAGEDAADVLGEMGDERAQRGRGSSGPARTTAGVVRRGTVPGSVPVLRDLVFVSVIGVDSSARSAAGTA